MLLHKAYESIKDRIKNKPDIAIVLGSGLGGFADNIQNKEYIPYSEIEGFPVSTVSGHEGRFVIGTIGNKNVIAMQGRVHYYEGYSMEEVVMPIRLMHMAGADTILITNAAGGINSEFNPGDLMIIEDHITSFVPSPLIGPNDEGLGTRFPDMSEVYNRELIDKIKTVAGNNNISLKKGIYLQTTGPNYETPAEIRMFKTLGADAVGMSTTCEAMVAVHMGMRVAGISCITNMASGISATPLNHKEVSETANKIAKEFEMLVKEFVMAL